jgi:hypothetical protein
MGVPQTKSDGVIAWSTMPAVIAVSAEHRHKFREGLADSSTGVCHFLFRGFAILITHR